MGKGKNRVRIHPVLVNRDDNPYSPGVLPRRLMVVRVIRRGTRKVIRTFRRNNRKE